MRSLEANRLARLLKRPLSQADGSGVGLIRVFLAAVGVLLGAYTLYGVVLAVHHGTNSIWVAFVASLMGALSALLIRAAWERPTEHVSARFVVAAFVGATLFGAVRGLEVGRNLTGLIIGAFIGALIGSLGIVVDRSVPRRDRHGPMTPFESAGSEREHR